MAPHRVPAQLRYQLYGSHLFTYWGDRMWEFSSIIFIMDLFKTTLLPSALFGVVENIAGLLFGAYIGGWVDRTNRLRTVAISLTIQNVAILCGITCFLGMHYILNDDITRGHPFQFLFGGVLLFGAIARLGFTASNIAVEKDWVNVLSQGDTEALAGMNSVMRRIDLICKIVAPIASGVFSYVFGAPACMWFIALYNATAGVVEYFMLRYVYNSFEPLQRRKRRALMPLMQTDTEAPESPTAVLPSETTALLVNPGSPTASDIEMSTVQAWKFYISHPLFWPSLAYCFLFASLINWGAIFTSYLKRPDSGLVDWQLAAGRGAAAFFGVLATYLFPPMWRKFRLYFTGNVSAWALVLVEAPIMAHFVFQYFDLWPENAWVKFFARPDSWQDIMFVTLTLSRLPLWLFDLAENQMLQEGLPAHQLGVFSGCQTAMTSVFFIISFLLGMIWSNPEDFAVPVMISFCCVAMCAILFSIGVVGCKVSGLKL